MRTPGSLKSFHGHSSGPRPLFPNSHGIISFADPHTLNPLISYRYKNDRGQGAVPKVHTCKPWNLPTRTIPLSPLESALPDKHRVLPVFSRNRPPSSPLDATLTRMLISVNSNELTKQLSSLESALTKN